MNNVIAVYFIIVLYFYLIFVLLKQWNPSNKNSKVLILKSIQKIVKLLPRFYDLWESLNFFSSLFYI